MKNWRVLYLDEWEVFAGETQKAILLKIPNTEFYFYYPKALTELKNSKILLENVSYIRVIFYKNNSKIKLLKKELKQYEKKEYVNYIDTGIEISIDKLKEKYFSHYKPLKIA